MTYTSMADLADTIRRNLWKIPADISLIVGVPRSGLLCALMIGEYLHKPVIDLQGYLNGYAPQFGSRGKYMHKTNGRVLVLDDTIYSGRSIEKVKAQVRAAGKNNVLYGCIYAEGKHAREMVDVYFENNYNPNEELWHLYEWNILQHGERLSTCTMFDLDGVLCADPPDERNVELYEHYIANAKPLVIPSTMIGAIVTYRRERYRDITTKWLQSQGVTFGELQMVADQRPHRNADDAAMYKAQAYLRAPWARLFVESEPSQAVRIAKLSGKQVFCYADGKMYY